jgi:hypothetical protein
VGHRKQKTKHRLNKPKKQGKKAQERPSGPESVYVGLYPNRRFCRICGAPVGRDTAWVELAFLPGRFWLCAEHDYQSPGGPCFCWTEQTGWVYVSKNLRVVIGPYQYDVP